MKPLNHSQRQKGYKSFFLVFSVLIIILFTTGFLTIKAGEKGVDVLEEKHKHYTNVFREKAALSFDIDEIIKRLNQLNTKDRNLSQYKQFQSLVTDIREQITDRIEKDSSPEAFIVYKEMVSEIKAIQDNFDTYKKDDEKYTFIEDQIEKCKEKYIEEQDKKNKK